MADEKEVELYSVDLAALEALLSAWGEPRHYARQVWEWIYRRWATSYDQMTTLPPAVRERLAQAIPFYVPPVLFSQQDPDGETRKDLLQLADGERIEVVLLRYRERHSACTSTQVGCGCGCSFCATGQMGFVRQLSSAEIIAQVLHLQRELAAEGRQLANIVLMGMGEPLLNYEHTLAAVRRLVDPRALGFTQRRITLSTVGIVPGIERLMGEGLRIGLAVSLHAATDELRSQLVPINQRYPLDDLFSAVKRYTAQTQQRVMFEWVMIDGLNDAWEQAQALAARLAGLPAHVNLILLNPTAGYPGQPAKLETIEKFVAVLDRAHIPHTMRQRRGAAISAGCGQLRCWESSQSRSERRARV